MKSDWQDCRISACCCAVGWRGAAAGAAAGAGAAARAGAAGETRAGAGAAVVGAAGGAVGAGVAAAGWVAAGALGAAAAGAVGCGRGLSAFTAPWHAGESLATLRCRHCKASAPPGRTLEQCDMKSERQLLRNAFCCSAVGCAAAESAHGPRQRPIRIKAAWCRGVLPGSKDIDAPS
jgi:hypothetical protein